LNFFTVLQAHWQVGTSSGKLNDNSVSNKLIFGNPGNDNSVNIHPWWVTGFVDGEGCFTVSITKNSELKTGWRVKAIFFNSAPYTWSRITRTN